VNKYELLYIISSSATEEQREELIGKVKNFIESKGGVIEGTDKWGIKKFAYPINFKNEGYYVLVNLTINPEMIKEINNLMNITTNVVRQMFIKK
jgi:small subunit ribosomal protein S6